MGGPPLGFPRDASTAARLAKTLVDPAQDAGSAACCRICLDADGELVTPCQCKGSVAYVHGPCLEKWRLLNFSANKADVCELCHAAYATRPGNTVGLAYKTLLPVATLAFMAPLAFLASEILPRLPRRSKSIDVFGMDLKRWSPVAFGWAFDADTLQKINDTFLQQGGVTRAAIEVVWCAPLDSPRALRQLLTYALLRLGCLGVLVRFLFSTKLIEPPRFLGRIRTRGRAVLYHYAVSCIALQGVQTPRTAARVPLFLASTLYGLVHLHQLLAGSIRLLVVRHFPSLEFGV